MTAANMTQAGSPVTGAPAHADTHLPSYDETAHHANASPAYSEYEVVDPQPTASPVPETTTTAFPTAMDEKRQLHDSMHLEDASHPLDRSTTNPFTDPASTQPIGPAALARGLQVPSNTKFVSSGFPYPAQLASHNIGPDDWSRFTASITSTAKMNPNEWTMAIGGGAAAAIVSGIFIGWLGVIPGVLVGHHIHASTEKRKLVTAMHGAGTLDQELLTWNETFFAPRGVLIRLDLPGEQREGVQGMDIYQGRYMSCGGRFQEFVSDGTRRGEKRMRKLAKRQAKMQRKAIRKGRIVIIPLNRGPGPIIETREIEKDEDLYGA
jgi:hypothetical protein